MQAMAADSVAVNQPRVTPPMMIMAVNKAMIASFVTSRICFRPMASPLG